MSWAKFEQNAMKDKSSLSSDWKGKRKKTFDVKIWMVAVDGTIFIKLFQAKPFKRISRWWQQEVGVSQVHSLILFSTQTFSSGNFYIKLPPPQKNKANRNANRVLKKSEMNEKTTSE